MQKPTSRDHGACNKLKPIEGQFSNIAVRRGGAEMFYPSIHLMVPGIAWLNNRVLRCILSIGKSSVFQLGIALRMGPTVAQGPRTVGLWNWNVTLTTNKILERKTHKAWQPRHKDRIYWERFGTVVTLSTTADPGVYTG